MSTLESIECFVEGVYRKNRRVIRIKLRRAGYTNFPLAPKDALFFETELDDGNMAWLTAGTRVFLTLSEAVPEIPEETT